MARSRFRWFIGLTVVLLALALPGAMAPLPAVAQPSARVYLLRGGELSSDIAMLAALRARGFAVDNGVELADFDGSQVTLDDYDLLVALSTLDHDSALSEQGVAAINSYVQSGGALLANGWTAQRHELVPLMPTTACGSNVVLQTVFDQALPHPAVNAGLPHALTVPLANLGSSEVCLEARATATLLYSSSNGGGQTNSAGLAAWNAEAGRVAAFSSLLSATELTNQLFTTLLQNTAAWLASERDLTPPLVTRFDVGGASQLLTQRELPIELEASDSGIGLGTYFLAEWVYSDDPNNAWSLARTSGWRPYRSSGTNFSWTLSDTPGLHYLQVFVADRAGNVSREPLFAFVSYQPAEAVVAQDQVRVYRVELPEYVPVQVRMEVTSGNPDLYVFGPDDDDDALVFGPESDLPVEETSFDSEGGVYQIEVDGFQAGSYRLSLTINSSNNALPPNDPELNRRPRGSVINLFPNQPPPDPEELPPAPTSGAAGALGEQVYLPLLRRAK